VIRIDRAAEVLSALAGGVSQREAARRTGVARDTVRKLARGEHPLQLSATRADGSTLTPTEKCPGCGRRIEMPCRACRAESYRKQHPRPAGGDDRQPLRMDLRPSEAARYAKLLERKQRKRLEGCFVGDPVGLPTDRELAELEGPKGCWTRRYGTSCPRCRRTVIATVELLARPEVTLWMYREGWCDVGRRCVFCGHRFPALGSEEELIHALEVAGVC